MSHSTEGALASLAGSQWGLLTAAQAMANGVARSTLRRREESGALERLRPGVYRLPGAPATRLDDIRAAWIATAPDVPAWERLNSPDVVVGGSAAAWAHQLGDLYPSQVLLYTRSRRQTRHDDVRYSTRHLPAEDVMVLEGLPVTTRERTIADLFNEPGADLSVVADALRDGERADADLDTDRLVSLLTPHAKRLGYQTGVELYSHLRAMTRVDEERLSDLLTHTNLQELVGSVATDQLRELIAQMNEKSAAQIAATVASLRESVNENAKAVLPLAPIRVTIPRLPRVELPRNAFSRVKLSTLADLNELRASMLKSIPHTTMPEPPVASSDDKAGEPSDG